MTRLGLPLFRVLLAAGAVTVPRVAAASASGAVVAGPAIAAEAAAGAPAPSERDVAVERWRRRDAALNEAATLTGGVGLLHTQHAQGGEAGQLRVAFTTEYFSSGFLCSSGAPCLDPRAPASRIERNQTDHIGGRLTLSLSPLRWLEAYAGTSAVANASSAARPSVLQTLGDSTLGAKAHVALSRVLHVGGALELWLVNGAGGVGLDGAGTSAKGRGLATVDLRGASRPLPLRLSANVTYVLDNSGALVAPIEQRRGAPISRVERFGLGVERVDHISGRLGAEAFLLGERVRPFVEYEVRVPFNRQGFVCGAMGPSGDGCLDARPLVPSTLTVGARVLPLRRGFALTAAVDVGITAVGSFIEELRPTAPWMAYLGAGWAFDTQERPPVVEERIVFVERPVEEEVKEPAPCAPPPPPPAAVEAEEPPETPLVVVVSQEIVLRQEIAFAVGSAEILPESSRLLGEIAGVLASRPSIRRVEVQGHTDDTGGRELNQTLSEERAAAVVAWLVAHGVAPERLVAKGYGDAKPVAPNATEQERRRNRRVQLIILEEAGASPASTDAGHPASSPSP